MEKKVQINLSKVVNTLKILVATQEPNDIKLLAHQKTLDKILSS